MTYDEFVDTVTSYGFKVKKTYSGEKMPEYIDLTTDDAAIGGCLVAHWMQTGKVEIWMRNSSKNYNVEYDFNDRNFLTTYNRSETVSKVIVFSKMLGEFCREYASAKKKVRKQLIDEL